MNIELKIGDIVRFNNNRIDTLIGQLGKYVHLHVFLVPKGLDLNMAKNHYIGHAWHQNVSSSQIQQFDFHSNNSGFTDFEIMYGEEF